MAKSTQKRNPATAEIPDELRRRDPAQQDVPAAEPGDSRTADGSPTEDGGVDQHPVHDSDMEDAEPQDFEEMIDAAGKGGFDPADKYEIEREAGLDKKHSAT